MVDQADEGANVREQPGQQQESAGFAPTHQAMPIAGLPVGGKIAAPSQQAEDWLHLLHNSVQAKTAESVIDRSQLKHVDPRADIDFADPVDRAIVWAAERGQRLEYLTGPEGAEKTESLSISNVTPYMLPYLRGEVSNPDLQLAIQRDYQSTIDRDLKAMGL